MIKLVKEVVCTYKKFQLVKRIGNVGSKPIELKSVPIWDQFFKVALDTSGPVPKTKHGNQYVMVAIDHY
jgi:type II secretory pathway component HofQ